MGLVDEPRPVSGITVARIEGALVAVKRAADDEGRLRHEADVLARVRHPGLVELLGLHPGPPMELRTRFAGPESWDRRPPPDDPTLVSGLAEVAATVADLHDVDLSHRALTAAHVIGTPGGRPVLCGLGDAGPADEVGRRADLVALGELLDELGEGGGDELGRRLATLADACRHGTLDARTLAARLDALEARPRGSLPRASARIAGAAVAVGMVAVGAWLVTTGDAADRPGPEPAAAPTTRPTTTTAVTTTTSPPPDTTQTSTSPTPTPSTAAIDPAPDPAGSTTPDPAARGGPELEHGGRRYGVGATGDVAVMGDWDCDGTETPAALRVGADTVAVFDAWPPPGEALTPVHTFVVPGAETLEVDGGGACGLLRVRTGSGSLLVDLRGPS